MLLPYHAIDIDLFIPSSMLLSDSRDDLLLVAADLLIINDPPSAAAPFLKLNMEESSVK
jgi:hypothetical protein